MSARDDDVNEMRAFDRPDLQTGPVNGPAFGDTLEQSALITEFLTQLRAFADEPAPEPSPALAALLGGATPLTAAPLARRRRHLRRNLAVAAAVGAAAVSLTGVAAANESLPQPAQRVVSNVVNDFTPFHINPSRLHPTPTPPGVAPAHHGTKPSDDPSREPADSPEPTRGAGDGTSEGSDSSGGGETESTGSAGENDRRTSEHRESPSSQPTEGDHSESQAPEGGSSGGETHSGD